MTDTRHTMSTEQFETNCTMIKDMVILQLLREGHITQEVYDSYNTNYSVILKPPSKFNSIWAKLTNEPDEIRFIIVKNVSMVDCSDDETPPKKTPPPEQKVISLFKNREPILDEIES